MNQRGSLLLEALLATVILSVSLTIIIQSMVASFRGLTDSAHYTVIVNLLENKMVELLQSEGQTALSRQDTFDRPYEDYQYALATSVPVYGDDEHIQEAQVQVMRELGRRKKSVELTTYLFASEKESEQSHGFANTNTPTSIFGQ